MFRALVLALALTACVADDSDEPSADEISALDEWASVADGKADLPGSFAATVAWLKHVYFDLMSAIWNRQEFLRTPDAALARVRATVPNATTRLYRARVQRLRTDLLDHSEVNIELKSGVVIRLVGDPKGAGAFVDRSMFEQSIGAPLCLTYQELEAAIRAAYVPGVYGDAYVCHTVTERVLRALGAGSSTYSAQIRTYAAARWTWGPIAPSWNPQDPADWDVSRSCAQ